MKTTAPIPTKFCRVTKNIKYTLLVVQIRAQQIQYGGRQQSWKINKLSYLSNHLTDFKA